MRLPRPTGFGPVKRWFDEQLRAVQAATPVRIAVENMPAARLFGQPVPHV